MGASWTPSEGNETSIIQRKGWRKSVTKITADSALIIKQEE